MVRLVDDRHLRQRVDGKLARLRAFHTGFCNFDSSRISHCGVSYEHGCRCSMNKKYYSKQTMLNDRLQEEFNYFSIFGILVFLVF